MIESMNPENLILGVHYIQLFVLMQDAVIIVVIHLFIK